MREGLQPASDDGLPTLPYNADYDNQNTLIENGKHRSADASHNSTEKQTHHIDLSINETLLSTFPYGESIAHLMSQHHEAAQDCDDEEWLLSTLPYQFEDVEEHRVVEQNGTSEENINSELYFCG